MNGERGTGERWRRLTEIFYAAIDRPVEERPAYLAGACGGDDELLHTVERLLAADEGPGPLDRPAAAALAEEVSATEPSAGGRVGPYRLLRRLGPAGVSTVWLAARDDREHRRHVALKVFHHALATEDQRRRWQREQQVLASLEHPHIARLYDAGATGDGHGYLVMEYVEGEPITEFCDRHRLGVDERIDLFRELCDAVAYAHRNLVLHRDVKPANVLVSEEGHPKLIDFGIAGLLNRDLVGGGSPPTVPWQRLLTPAYASPEQVAGRPLTTGTDVYSLGVLLFELLTGRRPFALGGLPAAEVERVVLEVVPEPASAAVMRSDAEGPDPEAVARARCLRPEALRRRLSGDLDAVIATALAKEPQRRYATADRLADDLARHRAGLPVTARPPTVRYRLGRALRRHRVAVATTLSVAAMVIAATVALSVLSLRLVAERDRAGHERDRARQALAFVDQVFEATDPNLLASGDLSVGRLLAEGERLADARFADQPEARADVKATIGRLYRRHGMPDRAEPLLREALALRRSRLGDRDPLVAETLSELGQAQLALGRLEAAEDALRSAVGIYVQEPGRGSPKEAEARLLLGAVLEQRGLYDEASKHVLDALGVGLALADREPRLLALGYDRLASLYTDRGMPERAEGLYREALRVWQGAAGEESVETADALNNLASSLQSQGKLDEAARLLRRALALNRRLRSADDVNVLANLNNLASIATRAQDFEEAERLYSEALAIAPRQLGDDHPNLSFLLLGLGRSRTALGRPEEAEEPLRRALAIRRATFPPGHFMIAVAQAFLGACLTDLGRYTEAEDLLLSADRVMGAQDPPREREALKVRGYLAALYDAWGRPERAATYRLAGTAVATAGATGGSD